MREIYLKMFVLGNPRRIVSRIRKDCTKCRRIHLKDPGVEDGTSYPGEGSDCPFLRHSATSILSLEEISTEDIVGRPGETQLQVRRSRAGQWHAASCADQLIFHPQKSGEQVGGEA